ncbi:hypothetical protein ACFJGX_00400 [Hydrogenophaga sp. UC242_50]|uniref:hypothetical protein n=1 Tax=Hydrogenophaga sp. UC242_50 TaxID=3350169 RepID=UPI0036D317FD
MRQAVGWLVLACMNDGEAVEGASRPEVDFLSLLTVVNELDRWELGRLPGNTCGYQHHAVSGFTEVGFRSLDDVQKYLLFTQRLLRRQAVWGFKSLRSLQFCLENFSQAKTRKPSQRC